MFCVWTRLRRRPPPLRVESLPRLDSLFLSINVPVHPLDHRGLPHLAITQRIILPPATTCGPPVHRPPTPMDRYVFFFSTCDIIRWHCCSQHKMPPVVTSVSWSVCLSVTTVSWTKTAEPIEVPFGVRTWLRGPRIHVLVGGWISQGRGAIWGLFAPLQCKDPCIGWGPDLPGAGQFGGLFAPLQCKDPCISWGPDLPGEGGAILGCLLHCSALACKL